MIAACGSDKGGPTAPPDVPAKPTPNSIRLQSDAGDYIGGGSTYNYTQATAIISVSTTIGHLSVRVSGDQSWWADMVTPAGMPLQVGTYSNLTRYPFNQAATGGLSWYGEGRGCNTLTGSFTIDSITYVDAKLTTIDLRFEQHCEGGIAALRGTIHWRADDTTGPPGPVDPIPAGLWRPDPAFTPSSGNYVFLVSDPGDYIGQGVFDAYAPPKTTIVLTASGSHISVSVAGWSGDFVAMLGTIPMKVGYYGDLRRYPFHNPLKGGLDWSGNGRGCNTLTGWFAVDRVVYTGTALTALDMRFEQHCEGATPALRGAIHWSA
jgi:hypothetical protein